MCRTEGKELDEMCLLLSPQSWKDLMARNDLIQEVYDSLVSSCPLCTTMAYWSQHTIGA